MISGAAVVLAAVVEERDRNAGLHWLYTTL